jgi:hypothetical protein
MKIGTIVSPWRYDAGPYHTLEPENTRLNFVLDVDIRTFLDTAS